MLPPQIAPSCCAHLQEVLAVPRSHLRRELDDVQVQHGEALRHVHCVLLILWLLQLLQCCWHHSLGRCGDGCRRCCSGLLRYLLFLLLRGLVHCLLLAILLCLALGEVFDLRGVAGWR
jgi:hypothetical protein